MKSRPAWTAGNQAWWNPDLSYKSCMTGFTSGQDELNPATWLATRTGYISLLVYCPLKISCFGPGRKKFSFPYNKCCTDQHFLVVFLTSSSKESFNVQNWLLVCYNCFDGTHARGQHETEKKQEEGAAERKPPLTALPRPLPCFLYHTK